VDVDGLRKPSQFDYQQGQGTSRLPDGTPNDAYDHDQLCNSAFSGKDCGRELARILQIVTARVDSSPKVI